MSEINKCSFPSSMSTLLFCVRRSLSGYCLFVRVEVALRGATFHVLFTDAAQLPPPFRVDNLSEVRGYRIFLDSKSRNVNVHVELKVAGKGLDSTNNIDLLTYSLIHSLTLTLARPLHLLIHPFNHPFIHPFVHSFIHPFIHPTIHPITMHSFVRSFVRSFIHSLIYSRCRYRSRSAKVVPKIASALSYNRSNQVQFSRLICTIRFSLFVRLFCRCLSV